MLMKQACSEVHATAYILSSRDQNNARFEVLKEQEMLLWGENLSGLK
jgi:hypothetical protein